MESATLSELITNALRIVQPHALKLEARETEEDVNIAIRPHS